MVQVSEQEAQSIGLGQYLALWCQEY